MTAKSGCSIIDPDTRPGQMAAGEVGANPGPVNHRTK